MKRVIICLLIGALALWLGIPNYRKCESIVMKNQKIEYFCEDCQYDIVGLEAVIVDSMSTYACDKCGCIVSDDHNGGMIYKTIVFSQEEIERYITYWKIATYSCIGGTALVLFGMYDGLRCLVDRIRYGKEEE